MLTVYAFIGGFALGGTIGLFLACAVLLAQEVATTGDEDAVSQTN